MSDGGGTGITTIAVLQSLAQARARWGEHDAAAIWDAAIVKIILGGGTNARDLTDLEPGRPRLASDPSFEQYRLVVFVLAYCGLRWSELAALRVGSIDFTKGRLTVAEAVVEVDGACLVGGAMDRHSQLLDG